MTPGGIITMSVSVTLVTVLFVWCIYKVLSIPGETEHMHGFEMEPLDEEVELRAKARAKKRTLKKHSRRRDRDS